VADLARDGVERVEVAWRQVVDDLAACEFDSFVGVGSSMDTAKFLLSSSCPRWSST
jgi:hypothetical protein